jgi:aryl-alcohol dehydrogenase-like predicted oxidoreductase
MRVMEYAYLGRSNVKVSKICLGTMHFGRRSTPEESFAIMDRALEMGIQFFDTANVYGDPSGRSEEIIGQWFKQGSGRREQVVLATKVYGKMGDDPNAVGGISDFKIRMNVADSLRRLQTDRIDLYQVHHVDRHISTEEFWGSFERLQQKGDILYVGTSNFPGWGLAKFQMAAWQRGNVGIVSEQSMYSLLCRYPELEVLPAAKEFGIGVIPYMPLAGGILTGKSRSEEGSRTQQVENEYGIKLGEHEMFERFSALCQALGESESTVAIAWTLHQPAVTSAIVGVRTVQHLEGLDRAASLHLDEEVLKRLDEIFDINRGRPLRIAPAPEAYAW